MSLLIEIKKKIVYKDILLKAKSEKDSWMVYALHFYQVLFLLFKKFSR